MRIARRLYNEALILSFNGTPSIGSMISLLYDDYEILNYLAKNTEEFLNEDFSLFQKKEDENFDIGHFNFNVTDVPEVQEVSRINKYKENKDLGKQTIAENNLIEKRFNEKLKNPSYMYMKQTRMSLPAWSCQQTILNAIQENQVVIISGETGCGKSTQVH